MVLLLRLATGVISDGVLKFLACIGEAWVIEAPVVIREGGKLELALSRWIAILAFCALRFLTISICVKSFVLT